jgi:hypothetical protein
MYPARQGKVKKRIEEKEEEKMSKKGPSEYGILERC